MHDEDREGYEDDPNDYLHEQPDDGGGMFVFGVMIVFVCIVLLMIRGNL